MIKELELKNFKCFKELKIIGLKQITIISGKNNAGKTSILDALFAFHGVKNPAIFAYLKQIRGDVITTGKNKTIWSDFFYGRKTSNTMEIKIREEDYETTQSYTENIKQKHTRDVSLSINELDSTTDSGRNTSRSDGNNSDRELTITSKRVKCDRTRKSENLFKFDISMNGNEINGRFTIHNNKEVELRPTIIVPTSKSMNKESSIGCVSKIIASRRKKELIEYLKIIDSKVEDIVIFSDADYKDIYLDVGMDEMSPLSNLGEGIGRAITFLSLAMDSEDSILLIDEFENGIHYSAIDKLMNVMLTLCEKNKNQIFMTTHSGDVLKYANKILSNHKDKLAYVRIDRLEDKEKTIAETFNREDIEISIKNNWEMR